MLAQGLQKLFRLLKAKTHIAHTDLCCVSIADDNLMLAVINLNNEAKPELSICEYHETENPSATLSELVKTYSLQGKPCSVMLHNTDYNVLLLESLPVPETEMRQALQWRVKELITTPLADTLIDYFPMPAQTGGKPKTLNVIVSKKSQVEKLIETVRTVGLQPEIVDIPELAFRNIANLFSKENQCNALVYIVYGMSQLTITRDDMIYLTRRLGFDSHRKSERRGASPTKTNDEATLSSERSELERLLLEVQRSFDYFQSQLRQTPPKKLLVASLEFPNTDLLGFLTEQLPCEVELFDLNSVMLCKKQLSYAEQVRCLPVIGGALRREVAENASANQST